MTKYCSCCDLSAEEYDIIKELSDDALSFDESVQIAIKKGKEDIRIYDVQIKLLKRILEYVLSVYSLYIESKIKTIPIDYEYIDKNLHKIVNVYIKLNYPQNVLVSCSF